MVGGDGQPNELSPVDAVKLVRKLAAISANIAVIIDHAKKRVRTRAISHEDIQRVLLHGSITEGPYIANKSGWWRMTFTHRTSGVEMYCVVEIEWATHLLVITAYKTAYR